MPKKDQLLNRARAAVAWYDKQWKRDHVAVPALDYLRQSVVDETGARCPDCSGMGKRATQEPDESPDVWTCETCDGSGLKKPAKRRGAPYQPDDK